MDIAYLDPYTPIPADIPTAYTDGSGAGYGIGPSGWAYWIDDYNWAAAGIPEGTNNIAELTAIAEAARANPQGPLAIVSDSTYAVNSIFRWAQKWDARGWDEAAASGIANIELIREARDLFRARAGRTYIKTILGHGKDKGLLEADAWGNKLADILAGEARLRAKDGQPWRVGPGERDLIHGRGRRRRSFTEPA